VHILDCLGVCDYISFGSESGDIETLREVAKACDSQEALYRLKEELAKGRSYASARQAAADAVLGGRSGILRTPNNLLGVKYIKAVSVIGSRLRPMTVKRAGSAHDSASGSSAGALRSMLLRREPPWEHMPDAAAEVGIGEMAAGRGPVFMEACELAVLSRLRIFRGIENLPGASEGLGSRFMRYAATETTLSAVFEKARTKRYAMSRLRRMALCACLGISSDYTREPPPYIRVLAMNGKGIELLHMARERSRVPVITKPASIRRLSESAIGMFRKESEATDFYVLGYPAGDNRAGGQEWRRTPLIVQ
jgi:predicted nucleotidyltransferase